MTVEELSREFDIYYNNIRSASAPGLDEYEKSIFLTEAQEEIVRNIYSPQESLQGSFEDIELKRRYIDKLLKQTIVLDKLANNQNIATNSIFFKIPSDLFIIAQEQLLIKSSIACWNNKKIDVIPMRHDEYNLQKKNPFRKPKLTGLTVNAWRLDYGDTNFRNIEIVYPVDSEPEQYILRYLKKPSPIVLIDLEPQGLTIDGVNKPQTCQLDSSIHRQIIKNAALKAKMTYDPKISNN